MIPRFRPQYSSKEALAALNVFDTDAVSRYEQQFATKFGCEHGVMLSHGRVCIYALIKLWGLQGKEVICPAYTCVVVADAIVLSGNTPVFVDCELGAFNMSLEGIAASITPNTRLIIATHLFGYPMDVDALQDIVKKAESSFGHKIYVIQDCAHSYGARWNGRLVSTYGDAAIFGSNISKVINSIFGGMVITRDKKLFLRLLEWRRSNTQNSRFIKPLKRAAYLIAVYVAFQSQVYGLVNWMEKKGFLDRFVKYYADGVIKFPKDWNQAPVAIEARVGLVQLQKYDSIMQRRSKKAAEYLAELTVSDETFVTAHVNGATYSHMVAMVENRRSWVEKYREQGIQLGIIIEYSIPAMSAYRTYRRSKTPISDGYAERAINFPLS